MNQLFDILKLYRSKNIGAISFFYLLQKFHTPRQAVLNIKLLEDKWQKPVELAEDSIINKEIELTEKFGAKFLTCFDTNFPKGFKSLKELPPVLITLGDQKLFEKNSISIVGTRLPSINGLKFCANLTKEFSEMGFVTVSGFAKGIDIEVHRNSRKSGTIAVFAGGIDVVYPQENQKFLEEIEAFTLFITDQPINSQPSSKLFPKRNALIAGLSPATVVIESTENSGALITARNAEKYGRQVFAVPGHPYDEKYKGNNKLLKNGASLITEINDILKNLEDIQEANQANSFEDFSSNEQQLVSSLISFAPTKIEEIANFSGFSIHKVLSIIVEMEIIGLLKINPDNSVYRISEKSN